MLIEYYTIRLKDAEPGKGLLHTTQHYDEIHSSIKHFKEKHPGQEVVAYKHEIKKGPMGATFKRKAMFGKSKPVTEGSWIHPSHQKELDDPNVSASRKKEIRARYDEKSKASDEGSDWHDKQKQRGNINAVNRYFAKHEDTYKEGTLSEGTKSFKTLMRSIEDKKSIKNLKVPSPSERNPDGSMKPKEEPKKIEEGKHIVMATLSNPNHTASSKRKEQIFRKATVSATDRDQAVATAHAFYKKQGYKVHNVEYHSLVESKIPFTHMVHVQGNFDNPMLEKRLKHCDGDYHQESDKGSWYKFKNKSDAKLFSSSMKHYAKDIYTGDVYHMNSNRVDEAYSTSDSFTETKHTHEVGGDKYEVRGEKYPSPRRPRHAIFKNGVYHSMAGTMMDAKARVNHIASTK